MGFTQANEKTAIACLTQHDWRLDIASDRFFQNAELYFRDTQPRQAPVDWKKIEQLFIHYKGQNKIIFAVLCSCFIWKSKYQLYPTLSH